MRVCRVGAGGDYLVISTWLWLFAACNPVRGSGRDKQYFLAVTDVAVTDGSDAD